MGYKVKLENFEGPFDLLVYLIESSEMSIYDIKVSEITEQYLLHVEALKETNINDIGDFMVLAAELIEIKSKMLLPVKKDEGVQSIEEDPRSVLVEKLLEYKRFKMASKLFEDRFERMTHVYTKPQEDLAPYKKEAEENIIVDTDKFIQAFELFLQRKKKVEDVKKYYERVERQKVSVESKMMEIGEKFRACRFQNMGFRDLLADRSNYQVALTFSALLEMIKQRILDADQDESFSEIEVKYVGKMEERDEQ